MRARSVRIFWRLYAPIALLLGFGMLGFLCLFWLPFALFLNYVLPSSYQHACGRLAIRIGLNFYLLFLTLLCGCRFKFLLEHTDLSKGSSVIIANHPSLLDAVLLLALVPNTVCVMKSSLLDNPLLGASARLAGFIRNADPFDMITHAKEVIGEGANLLLFPEGTRSDSIDRVNPLNQSIALLSTKLDLPIRSFVINYDQIFLGKNKPLISMPTLPMSITVKAGKVFYPSAGYASLIQDIEIYFNEEL